MPLPFPPAGLDQGPSCYLRKAMDLALPPVDEAATELLLQQRAAQGQQRGAEGLPDVVLMAPECLDMRCQVGGARACGYVRGGPWGCNMAGPRSYSLLWCEE
jgi:hypothetical protein